MNPWIVRLVVVAFLVQLSCTLRADQTVTEFGQVYRFDEKLALEQVDAVLGQITAELERRHLDQDKSKQQDLHTFSEQVPEVVQLGRLIAGIGEFSDGSKEIEKVFKSIYEKVGYLPIPVSVALPSEYRRMLGEGICRASDGKVLGGSDETHRPISSLIGMAKRAIHLRSGYKF